MAVAACLHAHSFAQSTPSNEPPPAAAPVASSKPVIATKEQASTVIAAAPESAKPAPGTAQPAPSAPSLEPVEASPVPPIGAPSVPTAVVPAQTGAGDSSVPKPTAETSAASVPVSAAAPVAVDTKADAPPLSTPTTAVQAPSTTIVLPPVPTARSETVAAQPTAISAPVVVTTVSDALPPTDLWDRIRSGFAMGDLDDELVGKWEKYYADRPEYVARIVDRSSKYMFYIVTELERRNMPLEIALLPMIESAFNPIAHSSAKASGIWQFIPSTGTQFGMKQDWWADSRRDIVAATNGALDYLSKLHEMFGDWQLALASYNWGEGSVQRAVARAKNAGRDGTYLTLTMPAETRNYLPKLQAVKNIIRNPAAYGLTIASVANEPYFKTITLAHAIDLRKAAQFAGMTEAEFLALNPAHNRPVIAGRGEHQILLPADKADLFVSRLESYDKPRVSWMAYKTRAGDRVEALAQRFGTTVDALRSVNGIRGRLSALPAGYHLLVPTDGPSDDALGSIQNAVFTKFPEYAGGGGTSGHSHKVRKGETLGAIAKRYRISTASLMKWNGLGKTAVRAGQTLYVSGPAPTRAQQGKTVRASYKKTGKTVSAAKGSKKSKAASKAKSKRR